MATSSIYTIQSDLAYPVLFYPDPSPSGRKSLVTDLQHMSCIHTVCVFDYPVPSPIRIFFVENGCVRLSYGSDAVHPIRESDKTAEKLCCKQTWNTSGYPLCPRIFYWLQYTLELLTRMESQGLI